MLISCLCPTFNRFPKCGILVEEAVECFLRQDHPDKELILLNDTPGQRLVFDHPQVRVLNFARRFPTLSAKIQAAIDEAQGDVLCRWDDDDISLPWRLSYSAAKLAGCREEWRAENYWYDPGELHHDLRHGNSHITAVFTRQCLSLIGGYPAGRSGDEDQAFNRALAAAGMGDRGETIPVEDVFYLYRWGVSTHHLSGKGGGPTGHQSHYDDLGRHATTRGDFELRPRWRLDHVERARRAVREAKRAVA